MDARQRLSRRDCLTVSLLSLLFFWQPIARAQESMMAPDSMRAPTPFGQRLPNQPQAMAPAAKTAAQAPAKTSIKEAPWTPVLIEPQGALPQTFTAGDGRLSLVYSLLLLNFVEAPAQIERLDVLDEVGNVVHSFSGPELVRSFQPLSGRDSGTKIGGGSTALILVHLSFNKDEDVPAVLTHKITFSQDLFGQPHHWSYEVAALPIDKRLPVVISAPLAGGRWVVASGAEGTFPHRRPLYPANDRLMSSQLYALTWCRIDDGGFSERGFPPSNQGSQSYGQPVLAVGDGTAVGVIDRFPDQVAGQPSGGDKEFYPEGNAIIEDIGGGHFVLYGNLKAGSIKVKEGQRLRKGQPIAEVGNSGFSKSAHLHLQLMDAPETVAANGLPFVIGAYNVVGTVNDYSSFVDNDNAGRPQVIERSPWSGEHKNSLPKEGDVVVFPDLPPPSATKPSGASSKPPTSVK